MKLSRDQVSGNNPPETELLLSLCRHPLLNVSAPASIGASVGDIDWEAFFARAAAWDVEAVAFSRLLELFAESVPDNVLKGAAKRERDARHASLASAFRTVAVVDVLGTANIESIVLKGPAVGIAAYGDVSARTSADIDLLLRRQDVLSARDVLVSHGYKPYYQSGSEPILLRNGHALEFQKLGSKVELHPALFSRHLKLDFDETAIWESANEVLFGDHAIKVLALDHLFVFLCAHGAKHQWSFMKWVLDVAQLASRMSQAQAKSVMRLSSDVHSDRIVGLALSVISRIFRYEPNAFVPVPEKWRTVPPPLLNEVVSGLGFVSSENVQGEHRMSDAQLGPLLFWIRCRERLRDRLFSLGYVLLIPSGGEKAENRMSAAKRTLNLIGRAIQHLVSRARV